MSEQYTRYYIYEQSDDDAVRAAWSQDCAIGPHVSCYVDGVASYLFSPRQSAAAHAAGEAETSEWVTVYDSISDIPNFSFDEPEE